MPRKRRVFGPLFYSTLVLAAIVLLALGARRAEPTWTTWRLTRQLGDSDPKLADRAATELLRIGPDALPWVVRAARDRNARARQNACWILATISPRSQTAALALIAALAIQALAKIDSRTAEELECQIIQAQAASGSK